MSALISYEQACANARRVLDQARADNARDYAEGRMEPERAAAYEQLLNRQRQSQQQPLVAAASLPPLTDQFRLVTSPLGPI
jgi:hypothetical protein